MLRRPSMVFLGALWVGLVCGEGLGRNFAATLVPLAVLGVSLPVFRDARARLVVLGAAFFLMGMLRSPGADWNRAEPPGELRSAIKVPVVLRVETPFLAAECSDRVSARVREVIVGPTSLANRSVMLRGLDQITPPGRSRFSVCGMFEPPRARLNPFGMDIRMQYMRLGLVGAVDLDGVVDEPGHGPVAWFSAFRERFEALVLRSYPGEASGMLAAMLLGQRTTISPHVQTVMLKAGTYHVIAVSGLHVVIVLMVLSAFLSILSLPRIALVATYCVAVTLYVMFTGTPASAVRAGGLFLAASLCRLLQWKTDFTNTACASGLILLIAVPSFGWDIGFQLSLGAVVGMTVLVPMLDPPAKRPRSALRKAVKYATSGLIVCIAAQAFTLPIVLYDFGRTSLIAPLGNLIMVPLTTLAIAGGIQASFALLVSETLAGILLKAASFFTHVSILATDIVTRLPHAVLFSGRPGIARMTAYCCGLACLSFGVPGMKRWLRLALIVALHGLLVFHFPERGGDALTLTFLSVGDGDATLIEAPGGEAILMDAGPNTELYGQAQNQVMRFLAMKGRGRLDRVVVSHPHDDHYGGLVSLIESFAVGELDVGGLTGDADYEKLLARAAAKGIETRVVKQGDYWDSGGAKFEILHAGSAEGSANRGGDANSQSVVARVTFGRVGFMFTGDITPQEQAAIAEHAGCLECQVLKVPHHGAPAWIDSTFLRRVGAEFAIISAGTRFGSHPSPATVAMLGKAGMRVLVTRADGAVTVTTDGRSVRLTTESGLKLAGSADRAAGPGL